MKACVTISVLASLTIIFCGVVLVNQSVGEIDPVTVEFVYLFDEGTGNTARDSSGKGNDGDIDGAKWVDGKFGKALEFDGVGAQVVAKDYFGVGGDNPRTTVLWWKGDTPIDHSWVKWGINADTQKYYVRAHPAGGECYLRVETQGGQHFGSTDVCDGQWHHLAVVFPKGSDSVKDHLLYVDGAEEKNTGGGDVGVNTEVKTTKVHIGAPLAHHVFANGVMDEVAVFATDLSEADINAIMNKGFGLALAVQPGSKLATAWGSIKQERR